MQESQAREMATRLMASVRPSSRISYAVMREDWRVHNARPNEWCVRVWSGDVVTRNIRDYEPRRH